MGSRANGATRAGTARRWDGYAVRGGCRRWCNDIIVRTHEGAALTSHIRQTGPSGIVVSYEADIIDPDTHLGWSVVAAGYAQRVTDPQELAQYQAMLDRWVQPTKDYAVRIHPDLVTGILLTDAGQTAET